MERNAPRNVFAMMFKEVRQKNGNTFWTACAGMMLAVLPYFVLACLGYFLRDKVDKLWVVCVCVGAILWGPLQYGYIKFYNKLTTEGNANIFSIYNWWNMDNFISVIIGGLLQAVCYIVCASIIIVPIIILKNTTWVIVATVVAAVLLAVLVAFFSMVFYFIEHHHYNSFGQALKTCYIKMRRNRMSMMSYKMLFCIFYLILAILVFVLGTKIAGVMESDRPVWGLVFAIMGITATYIVSVVLTAWYHASNHIYFEDILDYHERVEARKAAASQPQEKVEEQKEAAPAEVKKPVAKKAVASKSVEAKAPAKIEKPTAAKKPAVKKSAPAKSAEAKVVAPAQTKAPADVKKPVAKKAVSAKTAEVKAPAKVEKPVEAKKPVAKKVAPAKIEKPAEVKKPVAKKATAKKVTK